ncbi:MAG: M18 family aminopeptidase [Eubacterium sp.]|nr:M18 family aminopeptidase [Eubacterium sp.]
MNNQSQETADRLLNRIGVSTCSFTTVKAVKRTLEEEGTCTLSLREPMWNLETGKTYLITQADSSLFAFTIGRDFVPEQAAEPEQMLRMAAAHTDHPCLYIKSNPEIDTRGYGKLNVEVYGGAILNTWLDRAVSVAGKVVIKSDHVFEPEVRILDMKRPLFTIPNLAIHLNREVNKGIELNRQTDLEPLAFVDGTEVEKDFFLSLIAKELRVSVSEILDYELYLYNCDAGDVLGIQEDMISAPRLDNITSVEACLQGLLKQQRPKGMNLIALFDNEEIGSRTKQGADSELLYRILKKIYRSLGVEEETSETAIVNGFALSLDVAHGFHPNKPEKSDPTNANPLGKGVVIKRSSAQNYVTDSEAVATAMMIFENEGIPYQKFASRSDVSQGGTLGSLASKYLPMKMVDMGVPLLAMHSARELMAVADQVALEQFVTAFFNQG